MGSGVRAASFHESVSVNNATADGKRFAKSEGLCSSTDPVLSKLNLGAHRRQEALKLSKVDFALGTHVDGRESIMEGDCSQLLSFIQEHYVGLGQSHHGMWALRN